MLNVYIVARLLFPFGVPFFSSGASGWGSYHGRWGFETFSHRRACMLRGWALERLNSLRYPPYSEDKLSWLRWTASPKSCTLMWWCDDGMEACLCGFFLHCKSVNEVIFTFTGDFKGYLILLSLNFTHLVLTLNSLTLKAACAFIFYQLFVCTESTAHTLCLKCYCF